MGFSVSDFAQNFKDLGRARAVTSVGAVPRRSRLGSLSLAPSWREGEGVAVRR